MGTGPRQLPVASATRRGRRTGWWALSAAAALLGCAACGSPDGPVVDTVFGPDHQGSAEAGGLQRGTYQLEVSCTGASGVVVQLVAGDRTLIRRDVPCSTGASSPVLVEDELGTTVTLEVAAEGAEGRVRLLRAG